MFSLGKERVYEQSESGLSQPPDWTTSLFINIFFNVGVRASLRTSTNLTGSEVNDHVSLQWSSYKQPQGSNLRP
jgi:hypothetical protein